MQIPFKPLVLLGALLLAGGAHAATPADGFVDVLDLPAAYSKAPSRVPLLAITEADSRLVSVGARGHILYSDDGGSAWRQAAVPVSSDLTAVRFPTPQDGWAVGHDGVVLHSADGGIHWERQLDGRQIGQLMLDYYAAHPQPDNATWLEQARRFKEEGADKPFLDLWFRDANEGFVVGAFNLILHTGDGGRSWEPWNHRIDNPQALHLTAIAASGDDLFIVGEQGLLLRLSHQQEGQQERFVALPSPYAGSFFGIVARPGLVFAYGLRGHAIRSLDGGASWSAVDTGLPVSLTAASFDASGRLYLFSQAGQGLVSDDRGASFKPLELAERLPVSGAVAGPGRLLLVGTRGVRENAMPVR
ncbi:YCF48-related protein [Pseudomonas sp. GD04087]|uniref:WD40/YVTN/BNR-like repeat-containing protein n=1 Tax=unclassified Pseudomonas TaxID=196821 RepID=UPI002448A650|nr:MULTISPECIES: YCF48-related protein [unclassified Pseudomonas]MDH0292612.1 YCF48-related protein [Pseudomonas sp. GD04087]MDH1052582.1 YCF48-related protein [Pseudomonas sp. GD03903]MDH2001439.1 YCF48-related protein [Pseudomonas sp. GD03691]